MEWYALRVISGKEKKIRETLLLEVERSGYQDEIREVLVPSENIIEMRDGKKKVRNRVFFPGYLLIKMNMSKEARFLVENINGVMSFVGPKGDPQPLKPDEINRILGVVEGREGQEVLAYPFKVGDAVKVTDGPFMDFTGFVQEVNDEKQKLKVSVSIFGRPTPIELDFLQVELEK
ncbi:MAG: transcription termination/antitermination protein NusG [Fidelibacterota bacterium]